ncbi:hypothetical protein X551_03535 [Methylibium sp. T29]|nr:hypothetical protein X551_03535 [Methylibium sp. T29]
MCQPAGAGPDQPAQYKGSPLAQCGASAAKSGRCRSANPTIGEKPGA